MTPPCLPCARAAGRSGGGWKTGCRYAPSRPLCPTAAGGEWEVEAPDISEGLPKLIALGAPEELSQIVRDGVAPFCAARFVRLAKLLPTQGGTVELALDKGVLLGGGKELPFAEVEVELKSGSDRAAEAFAQNLAAEFGLSVQPKSKLARAMSLV